MIEKEKKGRFRRLRFQGMTVLGLPCPLSPSL